MIHGLIFDLGYTLLDFAESSDIPSVRKRMLSDLVIYLQREARLDIDPNSFTQKFAEHLAAVESKRRKDLIEYTTRYVLETTFEQLDIELPDTSVLDAALAAYYAYSETLWKPVPHMHTVLSELQEKGRPMALISNAGDDANVQRQIDEHRLRNYFDPIIVSAAVGIRKPHPLIFQPVFAQWSIDAKDIVMIGDTLDADVLGATHTGMSSIWLRTQSEDPNPKVLTDQLQPNAAVDTLKNVPDVLRTMDTN